MAASVGAAGEEAPLPDLGLERRLALLAIAVAVAAFGLLLLVVPAFFESFDEAKYIGIGNNVLAGRGLVSVYGILFLNHSPLWPIVLVAPSLLFGSSPLTWGHLFNAVAGLGLIALVAHLGWRIRPAAGGLAAAVFVGFVYLHDLTRTARLDVPAATLALAYIAVGLFAFERRSARWAALAGLVLGLAFLIKEIALPFAPVPILAALLWRVRGQTVVRLTGWIVLVAAVTSSWWFVVVAGYSDRVYRLGTPAWTLVPLGLLVFGGALAAIAVQWLADGPAGRRVSRMGPALQRWRIGAPAASREAIVFGVATLWFVLQVVFYSRSPDARLPNLFNLAQIRHNLTTWLPALSLVGSFSASGIVLAFFPLLGSGRGERAPLADLLLALICSAPVVLLVLTVGEPPRNYLAQVGLGVALAAGGWIWLAERVVRERTAGVWIGSGALVGVAAAAALVFAHIRILVALTAGLIGGVMAGGIAAWLFQRSRAVRSSWPALTVVPVAVLLASLLAVYAAGHRESATGRARGEAVTQVAAWVRGNVPSGTTIAFGSFLGYEMGNELAGRYHIVQIAQSIPRFDPTAPLGIALAGGPHVDDWIAVDSAPRNITEFQAFRSTTISDRLRAAKVAYWIYNIGTETAAPTVLAVLTPEDGLQQVAHLTFPTGGTSRPIESYVFRVDLAQVSFPTNRLYIAPDALRRLVVALAALSPPPRDVAQRLLERLVIVPAGAADPAVLNELRRLAAGS